MESSDPLAPFTAPTREWFRASFGAPTPAQQGAWSTVSQGQNALVVAPTGSGKTLSAFLWSIDRLFAEALDPQSPVAAQSKGQPPGDTGAHETSSPAGTRVLYISPLKALGVDIERNLRSPLVGIAQTARRLEAEQGAPEPPEISVGVRTGDTPAKERRDLIRSPPQILITTPESLYLMLTSQARATLSGVRTVIVDEVHALAGTKRGAHLTLCLERLDDLLTRPAQRIGLSATVEPAEEVARFLGGSLPVEVVAPPAEKKWDITVSVPVPDMASPDMEIGHPTVAQGAASNPDDGGASGLTTAAEASPLTEGSRPLQPSIWPHVEHRIVDLVTANRSTIVFVNSRRLAEKLTGRLNEIWAERCRPERPDSEPSDPEAPEPVPDLARSHHGSVSKEQRAVIEDDLKTGRLRCVVATSSLELGIDMGAVDLVIQVEAPHAVSAGLQRIGRAGHQVGETSVGWFFPKHRGDLVSAAVVVERMLAGRIEALQMPRNPLDVLAQHTVAAAAMDTLDVEKWFETVRRAAPFSSLPRSAYESTLDMLSGKYPSDRFAELRPRIVWDRDTGQLTGRPGAQRLAVTSGGTIPDRGLFGVYLAGGEESGSARTGGRRVGELDEEMVYESRVGDVFALGATSWRIEEITFDRVLVSPAFGQPASLPFWRGDGLGRPAELGRALGEFTRQIHAGAQASDPEVEERLKGLGMDRWARENLLRYLQDQHDAVGSLPSDTTLVVERTQDELGDWRIILHSPYGLQVHAPWALAVGERLHERYGLDGAALASDDGIILRVPMMDEQPPGAELFRFEAEELEELVTAQVSSSALFAGRFREAAARALLLPRQNPGQRTPLWQQRQRSSQLLEVASGYPDFPMIIESMREVLQDVYDLPALMELSRGIATRRVKLVEATTHSPSPFAQSILFGYIAQYLYEGDSPLAERRAAALSVDTEVLNELLGRVELREFLDAEIIAQSEAHAQRLSPSRRLRGFEGTADLLRLLGPLSADELARRLQAEENESGGTDSLPGAEISADGSRGPDDEHADDDGLRAADPETARSFAEQLVSHQRAFRLTWRTAVGGTEQRYASVEDAARLRDGLGVPIPVGIPQTFLEPVGTPLEDLVGRYARTHGPFTSREVEQALGLSPAVVRRTIEALKDQGRVVEGLFRPLQGVGGAADEAEYCETQMLRRIRRRSLAALRAAVEPVPTRAYAQFLLTWHGIAVETKQATQNTGEGFRTAAQLEGTAGTAEAVAQLAGAAAPASAWEAWLLPARVRDYGPQQLDELISSGEVMPLGRGALSGHDGWLALLPREDAEALAPPPGPEPEDPLQREILSCLARGGAWFPEAVFAQLSVPPPGGEDKVVEALWELFWAGMVVPDSFAAVRDFLASGSTAHRRRRQPPPNRRTTHRMALRRSVEARRSRASGPRSGRWALAPGLEKARQTAEPAAGTDAAHTQAEILLDRYGVVTRGSVIAEQRSGQGTETLAGGFPAIYKVLSAAEETGQIRRGYFVEQLGAAQFTASATIDQLRRTAERLEDLTTGQSLGPQAEGTMRALTAQSTRDGESTGVHHAPRSVWNPEEEQPGVPVAEVTVLAATDPANAYGAALDWPEPPAPEEKPDSRTVHRPGRKAGAVVALHHGELILYMERGGRTLLLFTEDADLMDSCAMALVAGLRRSGSGRLAVERVNGTRILNHRFGQALRKAGFHSSPSGLRLAP